MKSKAYQRVNEVVKNKREQRLIIVYKRAKKWHLTSKYSHLLYFYRVLRIYSIDQFESSLL